MLPMILESTLIPFGIQLWLCFRAKTPGKKWLPLIVVAVLDALCWGSSLRAADGGALTLPFLLSVLCILWLAGIGLAWIVYGVVKLYKNRNKNL